MYTFNTVALQLTIEKLMHPVSSLDQRTDQKHNFIAAQIEKPGI